MAPTPGGGSLHTYAKTMKTKNSVQFINYKKPGTKQIKVCFLLVDFTILLKSTVLTTWNTLDPFELNARSKVWPAACEAP